MDYPDQIENQDTRQLAMLVDGTPLCGATPSRYTLQAVVASLDDTQRQALERLREAAGPEIGVIDSHFDDSPTLLNHIGFKTRRTAGEDLGTSDLRVVAISCPHRHARLDDVDTFRFLCRGGVLLSSDRAARLPGIAHFFGHLRGRPPARARLSSGAGDHPDAASVPVWLDPGHLPVDPAKLEESGAETMARDVLTGDPLVVRFQTERGGLLHSVPHWRQEPHPHLLTAVERRPLQRVPAYRAIGNSYSGISLGGFLAQRAMVTLLIDGLSKLLGVAKPAAQPRLERGK